MFVPKLLQRRPLNYRRGFSLIEILVTMGVIAIITAIAVPAIHGVVQKGSENAARRNAQALAGMASSARAAGSTAITEAGSKEAAAELLIKGVQGEGQFADNVFMVNMEDDSKVKTMKFLKYKNGTLEFAPETAAK